MEEVEKILVEKSNATNKDFKKKVKTEFKNKIVTRPESVILQNQKVNT